MSDSRYDKAEICLNGHIINVMGSFESEHNCSKCRLCGADVISQCQLCGHIIRGGMIITVHNTWVGRSPSHTIAERGRFIFPYFCHNCGEPYPWTQKILEAAKELIDETELSDEDKAKAKCDVEDIAKETPRTKAAIMRLKRLSAKAGDWLYDEIRSLLVDITSETLKKILTE